MIENKLYKNLTDLIVKTTNKLNEFKFELLTFTSKLATTDFITISFHLQFPITKANKVHVFGWEK